LVLVLKELDGGLVVQREGGLAGDDVFDELLGLRGLTYPMMVGLGREVAFRCTPPTVRDWHSAMKVQTEQRVGSVQVTALRELQSSAKFGPILPDMCWYWRFR